MYTALYTALSDARKKTCDIRKPMLCQHTPTLTRCKHIHLCYLVFKDCSVSSPPLIPSPFRPPISTPSSLSPSVLPSLSPPPLSPFLSLPTLSSLSPLSLFSLSSIRRALSLSLFMISYFLFSHHFLLAASATRSLAYIASTCVEYRRRSCGRRSFMEGVKQSF